MGDMETQETATPIPPAPAPAAGPSEAPASPPAEQAAESPDVLREALAAKVREAERLQERVLRLQAEFENSKKRMAREKAEYLKFAHEELVLEFLPVLDNLEWAIASARAEAVPPGGRSALPRRADGSAALQRRARNPPPQQVHREQAVRGPPFQQGKGTAARRAAPRLRPRR